MFTGQMACELLNFGLKRWIKEERPQRKSYIYFLNSWSFDSSISRRADLL